MARQGGVGLHAVHSARTLGWVGAPGPEELWGRRIPAPSHLPFPSPVMNGFYSSRTALKGYIRESMAYHQAARQLQLLAGAASGGLGPTNSLYLLERALGVAQVGGDGGWGGRWRA